MAWSHHEMVAHGVFLVLLLVATCVLPTLPAKQKPPIPWDPFSGEEWWREEAGPIRYAYGDGVYSVFGSVLEECSSDEDSMPTGFTENGYCWDMGVDHDPDQHHVCVNMGHTNMLLLDKDTDVLNGKNDRDSSYYPRSFTVKSWCVCQFTFPMYIKAAGGCMNLEVKCGATNMIAFTTYKRLGAHDEPYQLALDCLKKQCKLPDDWPPDTTTTTEVTETTVTVTTVTTRARGLDRRRDDRRNARDRDRDRSRRGRDNDRRDTRRGPPADSRDQGRDRGRGRSRDRGRDRSEAGDRGRKRGRSRSPRDRRGERETARGRRPDDRSRARPGGRESGGRDRGEARERSSERRSDLSTTRRGGREDRGGQGSVEPTSAPSLEQKGPPKDRWEALEAGIEDPESEFDEDFDDEELLARRGWERYHVLPTVAVTSAVFCILSALRRRLRGCKKQDDARGWGFQALYE